MNALLRINRVVLTLLSVMTGVVKLVQMDAEMVIFRNIGFSDGMTIAFGGLQLAGGLLLLFPRSTKLGAWIMLPTFVFATGVLFVNGMVPFGVFSVLFITMAFLHARYGGTKRRESMAPDPVPGERSPTAFLPMG